MKRHSKPFGCTHDGCKKVFGAKNDWKRHENSQHHQLECWKCDIPTSVDPTAPCGKCVFRKADFVKHLRDVHNNTDGWLSEDGTTITSASSSTTGGRDVTQIISDCHIPKYHGGAFWCGFCKKVVKLNGKVGIEGWDKRFDHIAFHFEKEKKQVKDDWMKLEPSLDDKMPGDDDESEAEEPTFQDETLQRIESPPPAVYPPPRPRRGTGNEDMGWVCCKCKYGPYNPVLYADCSMCGAHRCQNCIQKPIPGKEAS